MQIQTYHEWLAQGRIVRLGEKAKFYAVDPNASRRRGLALFEEPQTETIQLDARDGWKIVPAEQWIEEKTPRKRVRVAKWEDGLAVWCGNNKATIKLLKDKGYRFNPRTKRWCHRKRDLRQFVIAMEGAGWQVDVDD